jgi:hypothetical protein
MQSCALDLAADRQMLGDLAVDPTPSAVLHHLLRNGRARGMRAAMWAVGSIEQPGCQPVPGRYREVDVGRTAGDRDTVRIGQQDVSRCRPDKEGGHVTCLGLDGPHDVRHRPQTVIVT